MKSNKIDTNYVFVDESGKPEVFSSKGANLIKSQQQKILHSEQPAQTIHLRKCELRTFH